MQIAYSNSPNNALFTTIHSYVVTEPEINIYYSDTKIFKTHHTYRHSRNF